MDQSNAVGAPALETPLLDGVSSPPLNTEVTPLSPVEPVIVMPEPAQQIQEVVTVPDVPSTPEPAPLPVMPSSPLSEQPPLSVGPTGVIDPIQSPEQSPPAPVSAAEIATPVPAELPSNQVAPEVSVVPPAEPASSESVVSPASIAPVPVSPSLKSGVEEAQVVAPRPTVRLPRITTYRDLERSATGPASGLGAAIEELIGRGVK